MRARAGKKVQCDSLTSCLIGSQVEVGWICFFFFFSSRRRHTRFDCDWSSDVCSSDLERCPLLRRSRIVDKHQDVALGTGSFELFDEHPIQRDEREVSMIEASTSAK